MADITMCEGGTCPKKRDCYRHTAPVNPWRQSYFVEIPWKSGEPCKYFGPNGNLSSENSSWREDNIAVVKAS